MRKGEKERIENEKIKKEGAFASLFFCRFSKLFFVPNGHQSIDRHMGCVSSAVVSKSIEIRVRMAQGRKSSLAQVVVPEHSMV